MSVEEQEKSNQMFIDEHIESIMFLFNVSQIHTKVTGLIPLELIHYTYCIH